jgi:hypothetical protein
MPAGKAAVLTAGGIRYIDRGDHPRQSQAAKLSKPREPRPAAKNNREHVAQARELRDRWLEQINSAPPSCQPQVSGKYDIARAMSGDAAASPRPTMSAKILPPSHASSEAVAAEWPIAS